MLSSVALRMGNDDPSYMEKGLVILHRQESEKWKINCKLEVKLESESFILSVRASHGEGKSGRSNV